jgi:hypothetical protein
VAVPRALEPQRVCAVARRHKQPDHPCTKKEGMLDVYS